MQLQSLPLFPLGNLLFPGGVLGLRVFEVRYLDMIGKCIKTGAPFGVVGMTAGSEVQRAGNPAGQERFAQVGTIAVIEQHESPQSGLIVLRCKGAQRFRITRSEQLKHGLWVADVDRIDDDMAVQVPPDLQGAATAFEHLAISIEAQVSSAAAMPFSLPIQTADCGWLANRWCELLPLQPELKQRLMELDNPLVRLELVNDILQRQGLVKS
jgi:uncharacterized protein